jgi:hypothetical protein
MGCIFKSVGLITTREIPCMCILLNVLLFLMNQHLVKIKSLRNHDFQNLKQPELYFYILKVINCDDLDSWFKNIIPWFFMWLFEENSILSMENGKDNVAMEDNCLEEERSYDSNYCLRSVHCP